LRINQESDVDLRKFQEGAAADPPGVPGTLSTGYPTDGDPGVGAAATIPGAYWFYQLAEEHRNLLLAAGIMPNHEVFTQLVSAINALISTAIGAIPDASTTVKGIVKLADSVISSSTTEAATANAVRAAYDRGSLGVTKSAAAQATADAALPVAGGVTMTGPFTAALGQEVEFANRLKVATLTYAVGELTVAEDLRGTGNYGWGHDDVLPASGVGVWGVRDATNALVYPDGEWKSFAVWSDHDGAFNPVYHSLIVRIS
jgi:hypothetical protein